MCALFTVVMLPRLMSPRIAEYVFYPASVSYVIFSAMAKYFCNKVFNKWWFLTLKSTWSSPISIYCTIKWSTLNKISKLLYFIDLNMARAVRNRQSSPRARISLSRKVMDALSWFRTSFLLTALIAHMRLSEILSAKMTCFNRAYLASWDVSVSE